MHPPALVFQQAKNHGTKVSDGEGIGYVTSGGYAHHVSQSMAMGYLPIERCHPGTQVDVEINGSLFAAKVISKPLYDSEGIKMLS